MKISRREMLQTTAAAVALPALAKVAPKLTQAAAPKFFTAAEFALADELTDMIIPTDQQSGGARAAGVAAYIDGRLAESFEKDAPQRWRAGLQAVEALSREMNGGKTFLDSSPEQRLAVLTKMAASESDPKTDVEKFFREIKGATVQAYYTSKVGIHDDQQYKGNVYQTGEYAGFDPT
jgi:hypothetical protein